MRKERHAAARNPLPRTRLPCSVPSSIWHEPFPRRRQSSCRGALCSVNGGRNQTARARFQPAMRGRCALPIAAQIVICRGHQECSCPAPADTPPEPRPLTRPGFFAFQHLSQLHSVARFTTAAVVVPRQAACFWACSSAAARPVCTGEVGGSIPA